MSRKYAPLIALALLVASLAPAAQAQPTPTPTHGGTLTVAVPADPGTWDPKFGSDNAALWAQQQIFATLLQVSPDGKSVEPWLAESYDLSPDLKTATFHLRQNANFCDGTPITASDVKFSFDRALEPDSGVSWQFSKGTTVDVVDDHTVTVTNGQPSVWFVQAMTLWGTDILSQNYYQSLSKDDAATKPLGSGPFCLDSWDKGSGYVLKPNPGYWGTPAWTDQVNVEVVQDDNARVLQLESGAVDIALDVPTNQVSAISNYPGVQSMSNKLWCLSELVPNEKGVPGFADKNVRQAMSYAIDRQALVNSVLLGQGEVAKSVFYGSEVTDWTGDFAPTYDLDKAKQLMAQSAFPNGFNTDFTIKAGDSVATATAVIVKDMLSKIGINVNITPVEAGTWFSTWSSYNYQMTFTTGCNGVVDPAENIPFEYLQVQDGGQGAAFTGWSNPEVTRLAHAAEVETDSAKRAQEYYDLQRIAMDEMPQIPLFHPMSHWGQRDDVFGFTVSQTSIYHLWDAWKSD
jgi:peptide/nickel transport system substrate-binding protein